MKTKFLPIPDIEKDFFSAVSYRDSLGFDKSGQRSEIPVFMEKISPCRKACPIGVDIAKAFHEASKGKIDEALRIYRQENPLPGICGRVCYHPCELSCNRKDFDEAVNIRGFERFLSDHGRVDINEESPVPTRKEKIGVIGSGPAGLSASYHLARLGYSVTIFESMPEPGGMLRYGIPEYRLPKKILRREIGYIQHLGVEIKTGIGVGIDLPLTEITKEFWPVFIAVGAQCAMGLGIEGEKLPGVMKGIRFLRGINLGERTEIGKKVAVIGGGNTAIDCARAARRIGGGSVRIIYRRSRAEMPALAEDVAAVEREGIKIDFLSAPKRLISENGELRGIECIQMELGGPGAGGRPRPIAIKGSEFTIPADTVIVAVGQVPETEFGKQMGLSLSKIGMIEISDETSATNIEGVYAGGDSAGGKAFVADAIASGKIGALAIFCFLEGKDVKQEFQKHQIGMGPSFSFQHFIDPGENSVDLKKTVSFDRINTLFFRESARNYDSDQLKPEERIKTFGEITSGLTPSQVEDEISRCFKCGTCTDCGNCLDFCPDLSILKDARLGIYGFDEEHCKGCGICSVACPRNIIEMVSENEDVSNR